MPLYDFTCNHCGATREHLTPPTARHRKCVCGRLAGRVFPLSFHALNTESANGEAFKHLDVVLGRRVSSVGEQSRVMQEIGCVPANSEYHAAQAATPRQEITEKELHEVLNS